ncbi:MAG: amidase [Ferrovibrionaceae bacterium]
MTTDGFVRATPIPAPPLAGTSFAVKDLIDVAGTVTGGGNPDWAAGRAPAVRSAPVVDALLAAGARLAGKTMTDELAFSLEGHNHHYGTPINPAAPDRLPGGSSSGSASVTAAGLVDFALGTDTGGSVRIPASFCGLYAMRPSHGRLPLDGVVPFAPSYDTIGWFARDAAMLARVGAVLLGPEDGPAISRFVVASDAFALADPAVAHALRPILPKATEITIFDGAPADWREAYRVLQGAEIWAELGPWITANQPRFGPAITPRFADAAAITVGDVGRWQAWRGRIADLLAPDTALLLPTSPVPALLRTATAEVIGDFYTRALTLTSIAGHAGLPQVTAPLARVDGLPVGLSLIGAAGRDRALLQALETLVSGS